MPLEGLRTIICIVESSTDMLIEKDAVANVWTYRDLLQYTGYRTVASCHLKQACENALRDWNKVFGEGYMVEGETEDWNTESPLRTCTTTVWTRGPWG